MYFDQLISVSPYAGPNSSRIRIGPLTVWISYKTIVGIQDGDGPKFVRENSWGPPTGGHLNMIDGGDKASRLRASHFEAKVHRILSAYGLDDEPSPAVIDATAQAILDSGDLD